MGINVGIGLKGIMRTKWLKSFLRWQTISFQLNISISRTQKGANAEEKKKEIHWKSKGEKKKLHMHGTNKEKQNQTPIIKIIMKLPQSH